MRLEIDPEKHLVRHVRSAQSYESVDVLRQSIAALLAQMTSLERGEYVLLQDMRAPRGRNDPEFEAALASVRTSLSTGFRRVAVLVSTNIGRLQVQRYLEVDRLPKRAFLDEQTALHWLEAD